MAKDLYKDVAAQIYSPTERPLLKTKWGLGLYLAFFTASATPRQISNLISKLEKVERSDPRVAITDAKLLDALRLQEIVMEMEPMVSREHFASGIEFLNNKLYTPKGKVRCTDDARQLAPMARILRNATHIRLVSIDSFADNYRMYCASYKVVDDRGCSFMYDMLPWQKGKHFSAYALEEPA